MFVIILNRLKNKNCKRGRNNKVCSISYDRYERENVTWRLHGFLNHEVAGGRALEEVIANLLVDARSAHGVTEIKIF
jgi:hypothetical protein